MNNLKPFIDYLKNSGTTKEEALNLLLGNKKLAPEEKRLILCYCYPRPLSDYGLPARVQEFMSTRCTTKYPELIIEASETPQYGRFVRHLFHSFLSISKVGPAGGDTEKGCSICGKTVYGTDKMDGRPESDQAYTSSETSVFLCRNCLEQLIEAYSIIEDDINPGFLASNNPWKTIEK